MKSSTALPSLRNSGLLHRWKGNLASLEISAWIFPELPTGTVDLVTMTVSRVMYRPASPATSRTYFRSADPSSPGGVPTAMKRTSTFAIEDSRSVVKESLPSR
jgi:hypothetical protein